MLINAILLASSILTNDFDNIKYDENQDYCIVSWYMEDMEFDFYSDDSYHPIKLTINWKNWIYKINSYIFIEGNMYYECIWCHADFDTEDIPKIGEYVDYLISSRQQKYSIKSTTKIRDWVYQARDNSIMAIIEWRRLITLEWDFKPCKPNKAYTKTFFEKDFDNYKLSIKELDAKDRVIIINQNKITDEKTIDKNIKLLEKLLLEEKSWELYKDFIEKKIKNLSNKTLVKAYYNYWKQLILQKKEYYCSKWEYIQKDIKVILLNYFWNKIWLEILDRFWE